MRKATVVTVVLFIIFAFVQMATAEPAPTFDPQSLVGKWWGEWHTINGKFSGGISITVKKVENNKVFGTVEATGANELRYEKFEGILKGNVLSIILYQVSIILTVNDKIMKGTGGGRMESSVELKKRE